MIPHSVSWSWLLLCACCAATFGTACVSSITDELAEELGCGDGVVDRGEACDDGNNASGDGCSSICGVERGYTCEGEPSSCREGGGEPDPSATCGNGMIETGEACDDGNVLTGDGCGIQCQVEEGWDCIGSPSSCAPVSTTEPVCGDGVVEGDEACDDGNVASGDGCDALCAVEPDYECVGSPSVCTPVSTTDPVCGDGLVEGAEACDDGNTVDGDGCTSACAIADGFRCIGEPSVCSPESTEPACGNGFVETGETCDDGNTLAGDGCSNICVVESGYECTGEPSVCESVSTDPVCGDGVVEASETCDDGNLTPGDGCSSFCDEEPGYECSGTPSVCSPSTTDPVCGNGSIESGELCDDGNRTSGDGCNSFCTVELGYECTGEPSTCTETVIEPVCGNGDVEGGEICDDGNATSGDGCSSACLVESGYECMGEPSVCTGGPCEGVDCSDLDSMCGTGVCNPDTGACEIEPAAEGADCSVDECSPGVCESGVCNLTVAPDCTACGADDICIGGYCGGVPGERREGFESGFPTGVSFSGDADWVIDTSTAASGSASARSGDISDSDVSSMSMSVTLADAGTVSFFVRISTESCCDDLIFLIDGTEVDSRAGTVEWTEVSYPIAAGTHTLTWTYDKDISISSGSDAVWIDELVIEPTEVGCSDSACGVSAFDGSECVYCPVLDDGESCDDDPTDCTGAVCDAGACVATGLPDCSACGPGGSDYCAGGVCGGYDRGGSWDFEDAGIPLDWTTGGDANWSRTTADAHSGSASLRSGTISHLDLTYVEATVTLVGDGSISFWYRVSSESNYDYLTFFVDEAVVDDWSGTVAWTEATYPLSAGTHTVAWAYEKDGSLSSGSDAAWIDDVIVSDGAECGSACGVGLYDGVSCLECGCE